MEQPESIEPLATVSDSGKVLVTSQGHTGGSNVLVPPTSPSRPRPGSLAPLPCPTCGVAPPANGGAVATPSYIYAIGRIEPRFPSPSVEKEFIQATGRAETAGLTDRQAFQNVLSQRRNRYLTRQLCWVLTIEALETYILVPRDPGDFDLLVEALRSNPTPMDLDISIGTQGPIAPPELCNGLMVPIVVFDQIYSFDRDAFMKAIPRPEKTPAKEFAPAAEELFDRIMQMTDNAGATDEHRALNYLAVRYQAIYANAAEAFARNASLTAVYVQPSPLSSTRKVVDVIFSYTNRNTDVTEKFFVRVDVTEEFPFLVTKMSPYYDRYI
jgi:cyclic patellamide precursor peptide PatG